MKKNFYIRTLSCAATAFAMAGAFTACSEAEILDSFEGGLGNGLAIAPVVTEATVVTRAASVEELKEKQLNTLDVFVEHVTGGTGDDTFLKKYHLTAINDEIGHQIQSLLADNWRLEGLRMGEKYNVYVAVNNTKTTEATAEVASATALKALTYSEVEEGTAVVDETTNNISWPWTDQFANTPSGFIYKQYVDEADAEAVKVNGNLYGFTTEKEFMMDGVLKDWTPASNTLDQVFDVTLNRAAAKVVLNVKFDADFLKSLTQEKNDDGEWVDKPADEQISIINNPAWRFYNFAFGAPVFTPETQGAGVEVHNSATLLRHPYGFAGDDKNFQIITYSYPNKWDAADYATKAPSLVISVPYKKAGEAEPEYGYYRIPLVKSDVTAIERNHIYVINATIATRGSELHEDEDVIEDVIYNVLPWNDENNSQAIHNEVQSVQHYYFNVNPKVYTLRGDGDQSVVLNYSKASGTKVNWSLFTYDAQGNQTGVVANNANNAIRAWYYDADGDFTTTYNDNSGVDWSNSGSTPMGVSIVQSGEGTSGSTGTVTVTSTALNNKAIKYIRLRVYLDEPSTFDDDGNPTMYEDIIIRHFPTDNIQNIAGLWSSYHDANAASSTTTYKTRSLTEAESLAAQYGISYSSEELTETEYINYNTYIQHQGEEGYSMTGPESLTRQQFAQAVTSNANRRDANGQANARLVDQWYYWGVNPSTTNNQNQADYYTGGGWFNPATYYAYASRYRAQYTHTYTYTEYTLELPIASTGDWVNWAAEDRANHAGQRTRAYSYTNNNNSQFVAKVFNNGTIYYIQERNLGGGRYETYQGGSVGLTNNHMYVIQISSTSDDYVLGRPYVNQTTHQSQDDVVSPAFMIASQLGAVTTFTGNDAAANAATHCSRYMEVTADGTYYTGWRLPTPAEIRVITGYQYGNIDGVTIPNQYQSMTPVLTGRYYWSLSGERILTRLQNDDGNYLRCVRDLSAEEVERLNGFEKIQEKYRNQ